MTDKMAASHRHVALVHKTIQGSITLNKASIQEFTNHIDNKGESVSIITVIGSDEENLGKLFTEWLLTFADAKLNGVSVSSFDLPRRDSFDNRLKAAYPKDCVVCFETYLPTKHSKCLILYAPSSEVFQIFAVLASSVIVTFEKSQKAKIQQLLKCLDLTSTNIALFHYNTDVRPGSVDELKMGQKFQQYLDNLQIPECVDSIGKQIPLGKIALHFEGVINTINGAFDKRDVHVTTDQDKPDLSLDSGCTLSTSRNAEGKETLEDIPMIHKTEGYAFSKYAQPGCKIPAECVPLQIRCPAFNCASEFSTYRWICAEKDCSEPFQYDFNNYVYCKCGRSKIKDLRYRCPLQQDCSFRKPDPEFLESALKDLKPLRPLNILILGETGVGKSTWINGFVNFLSYGTLDIAERGELQSLVPTKFTVYNEDFEEIVVSTGNDKNEVYNPGESATQTAKIYPFKVGEGLIRIIDTPGIGDTRGPTQDQQNFENILGTLSGIEELHGICILLKPNNSRLNVMFRFCIKELLTYLHRDASKNILFCFTNSRGTFYRPGDTMPALLKLLSENKDVSIPVNKQNIFCFDSESFRFLAAIKNNPPVSFTEEERANFANSWTKSIQETGRMLEYIQTLPPHHIKNTLNLNNTRQLVLKLARPLAEINRNIRTNKKIQEDHRNDIRKTKENVEALQKKRMTKRTTIKVQRLNHPKTVCSNSSCVKVWRLDDNITTNEYITACHNPCKLTGTPADSIGHSNLMKCWAMNNNYCRICTHSYREHLHVYYDSIQELEEVVDSSVDEAIKSSKNAQELKEKMILNTTLLLSEYDMEIKIIEESCAYFAHFLKTNAITPYNDAVEQYLDHFINEEKAKVKLGGSKKVLKELEASKASYLEQKRILDESMRTGDGLNGKHPMSQQDIWNRVKDLRQLKHSGKNLREALECVTHSQYNSFSSIAYKNTEYTTTWGDGGIGRVFKSFFSKTLGIWSDRRFNHYK